MVTKVFSLNGTRNEHGVDPVIPLDNVTRAPVGSELIKSVSLVVPHPVQTTAKAIVANFIMQFIVPGSPFVLASPRSGSV